MSSSSVRVRVVEGHVVYVAGVAYDVGAELDVTDQEADALVERGTAKRVLVVERKPTPAKPKATSRRRRR